MDDPLSAVDAEVGRHLFEKCIRGILKDKVCILVTHQLQFLKNADQIMLLNRGKVDAQGTYTELLKTGINFAQLLESEENPVHPHPVAAALAKPITKRKALEASVLSKGFRRSASASMLEMSSVGDPIIPSEFEIQDDDSPLIKSFSQRDPLELVKSFQFIDRF